MNEKGIHKKNHSLNKLINKYQIDIYLKNQFKESSKKMKISVIVATYNRIDALDFVLQSLENQTDCNFEVLIADDGSKFDTKDFINSFRWHWRSHL